MEAKYRALKCRTRSGLKGLENRQLAKLLSAADLNDQLGVFLFCRDLALKSCLWLATVLMVRGFHVSQLYSGLRASELHLPRHDGVRLLRHWGVPTGKRDFLGWR